MGVPLQVVGQKNSKEGVALDVLEDGATLLVVEAGFGVYAEYIALGRVKSHAPVVCPSLQLSRIVLEGVVVSEGVYLPIKGGSHQQRAEHWF